MTNQLSEKLIQGWSTIHQESGQAIDWIGRVRGNARSVDSEADALIVWLRRLRNEAKNLGVAAGLPSTVGFFGLSQAGKSWLISALAAGGDGELETLADGQRLNFMHHVNPPGSGKEATGLVTRFSARTKNEGPTGFPIELKLFQEIELVKVLCNSFYKDFNLQRIGNPINAAEVKQRLNALETHKRTSRVVGVSEDDMVSLWDYLIENIGAEVNKLPSDFLPRAVSLAPYLTVEDRAQLFSCLWGPAAALTDVYLLLAKTLAMLGNPSQVFAPIEALARPNEKGGLSQTANSIMNVDTLKNLGGPQDATITVLPSIEGQACQEKTVTLAQLAALTAELIFPLVNPPSQKIFEEVDLLDFPGYRGRLGLESFTDISGGKETAQVGNPIAELLLRGKVAYLFARYTETQEMNVLVVCHGSTKQSDVAEVGPVLEKWVHKIQGETAEQRAARDPGLIWALTMFDLKINDCMPKNDESTLTAVWAGLVWSAMQEKFGKYDWMTNWSKNIEFNNTFLVRKPRFDVTWIDRAEGQEIALNSSKANQLKLLEQTFVETPAIKIHVAEPELAWNAMLKLNDGGIERLSQYLAKVSTREVKLGRIKEQMESRLHDLLENRLGRWFHQDGMGAVEAKQKIQEQVKEALRNRMRLLADIQHKLQLQDSLLQSLYFGSSGDASEEVVSTEAPLPTAINLDDDIFSDDLDVFGDAPIQATAKGETPKPTGSDARFAKLVLSAWFEHLRSLPYDDQWMNHFGLQKNIVEMLCNEMLTAGARVDLQEQLFQMVSRSEQAGIKRERLVGRQVFAAKTVLSNFITWLGYVEMPIEQRPDSLRNKGRKLFEQPARVAHGQLPVLGNALIDHKTIYWSDWLVGFLRLILDNAAHDSGREIKPEQNAELGTLIANLKSAQMVSA
jgi:hypothetical protein